MKANSRKIRIVEGRAYGIAEHRYKVNDHLGRVFRFKGAHLQATCCDCGLVHDILLEKRPGEIVVRFYRNNGLTHRSRARRKR